MVLKLPLNLLWQIFFFFFLTPSCSWRGPLKEPFVYPSICPFVRLGVFLELYHYLFLNFGMVLETYMTLFVTELDFPEKTFCSQNWENGPKMCQKQGCWNMLKSLVINFYWICSVMKIYIILCVPAQIPYLGTFLFLRYGPIRLQDFQSTISPEKNSKIA